MNIKNNHLVIMAGGVGSRFWPMSTPDYPKQFIDVLGCGRTLIQLTADRFQGICPPENIWVVTSEKYADTVKEQLPDIADDHILREPCRRNTAPIFRISSSSVIIIPNPLLFKNSIIFSFSCSPIFFLVFIYIITFRLNSLDSPSAKIQFFSF